jgi:hypothetical protein
MDATQAESPALDSSRTTGTRWRLSPSVINCLYFVLFLSGIGLAVGLTGVYMQATMYGAGAPSHTVEHATQAMQPRLGGAPVAQQIDTDPPFVEIRNPGQVDLAGYSDRTVTDVNTLREAQLKRYYLECARDSSRQRMDPGDAAICSEVADILLAHSFDGDFTRMIDWWRTQRDSVQ